MRVKLKTKRALSERKQRNVQHKLERGLEEIENGGWPIPEWGWPKNGFVLNLFRILVGFCW